MGKKSLRGDAMKLFISTLGAFDIKFDDTSLIKPSSKSYRLYKLLKYLITFRNKKLLSDTIIENVWADHESYDPYNMLRAQIYRLRKQIKSVLPKDADENLYMSINFINGYYSLDIGENVIIDIDEFGRLITLGDDNIIGDVDSSVKHYENALEFYKGPYLEEYSDELWIIPVRNYYSSLYTKTLFKLIEILEFQQDYEKIIEICQDAIILEPENEDLHIHLMQAMLKLGRTKDAESHYEYISLLLDNDKATNPLLSLQNINRKIQTDVVKKDNIEIIDIESKIEEEKGEGPLKCNFENFKFFLNTKRRKRNIGEKQDYITIITLKEGLKKYDLEYWSDNLSHVLKKTLRQGDVYTFWNELQVLILLENIHEDEIINIENRIRDNLNLKYKNTIYDIQIKSAPITPEI